MRRPRDCRCRTRWRTILRDDNRKVLNFITSKSIKRIIARVDIHFSNSMVESLFRMLKSNFLKTEKLRSLQDVKRKIDFFFIEHNEVIPRHQFDGATPMEKFLNTWTMADLQKLDDGMQEAAAMRVRDYKKRSCAACEIKMPSSAFAQATFI